MNFGWLQKGGAIDAGNGGSAIFAGAKGFRPWNSSARRVNCSNAWAGFPNFPINVIALPGCGFVAWAAGAHMQLQYSLSNTLREFTDSEGRYRLRRLTSKPHLKNALDSFGWKYGLGTARDWALLSTPWFSLLHMGEKKQMNSFPVMASMGEGTSVGAYDSPTPPNSSETRSSGRVLTNCILGLNILMYIAQMATAGELLLWGAKVNGLIDQGQLWRLVTPAVLHANVAHLMVNLYSLNSVGPAVESLGGPKRFTAVYIASAITSSTCSYFLCKTPSVGASGAIFGLVGALAVFLARHMNILIGGKRSLQEVARVIVVNMAFGLGNDGIDNWGHVGGLIGGAAISLLIGPVYALETPSNGGKKFLVDRSPILRLLPARRRVKD